MNYSCFIVKIITEPIFSQFEDNISLVEMLVKFSTIRKIKSIEKFRLLVWGDLADNIIKDYHVNDYIIVEGYIRNFYESETNDQVEVSARKIYPFLLNNWRNIEN